MDKLYVCVVSETLRRSCLPNRLFSRGVDGSIGLDVVSVSSLGAARALFTTLPIACLVVPATFRGQTTTPFLEDFRNHHPKVPIIIYGKAAVRSSYAADDANIVLVSAIHPHRLSEVIARVFEERAFRLEDTNPCTRCAGPCSSSWPQKLVEHHNFFRRNSVQEVAYHL